MFVANAKKGAMFINAAVLLLVVVAGVIVAQSLLKIKKDPKNPEGYRSTLDLGKK